MTVLKRVDELPELVAPDGSSLVPVEEGGILYKARVDSIGGGGGGGGGGFYQTIEFNGTPLQQRAVLNVTGLLQAMDSGGETQLTLPAIEIDLGVQVSGVLPISNGGTGLSVPGSAGQSIRYNSGGLFEIYTPSAGLNAPANPTDDAKVAVASGGNLSYAFIGTANISPSAGILLSQLQAISADRLLGADDAGVPVQLTVGGGFEFTGTGGLQRSALTGAVSASAGSGATAYASTDFSGLAFISQAAVPPASGMIRWGSNASYAIVGRTTGGADQNILQWTPATPRIEIGANGVTTGYIYLTAGAVQIRVGTDYVAQALVGSLQLNNNTNLTMFAGSAFNIHVLDSNGAGATAGAMNTHAGDATSGAGGGTGGARFDRAGNATGSSGTRNGGDYNLQAGGGGTASGTLALRAPDATGALGTKRVAVDSVGLGFFNTTPVAKPTVSGSHTGLLSSILTALSSLGLLTNSAGVTSPAQQSFSGNVETSSTALTTVLSIDTSMLGTQCSAVVEIFVTCVDSIGQGASKNICSFSRQGGTLTNLSALTANGGNQANGTVSVAISGANLLIQITAVDGVNYRWEALATVTYSNTVA